MNKQRSCKERVQENWDLIRKDLKELIDAEDHETEDLGKLEDYGLCINLVEAGTFKDRREDYIRYQLSWGGPGDELRFYKNGDIEYWFLDWFDGARIDITDDSIARWLKDWVEELGFWEKQ